MSTSIDKKLVITAVSIMVIGLVGYAALVESAKKETSSISTVGTLSVEVTPFPSSVGTETFSITYNAPGTFDFTGWSIETDSGETHMISADPVSTGETLTVCGESIDGLGCSDLLEGFNVFDNNVGVVTLSDTAGTVVTNIDYEAPEAGQGYGDAPDFKTTVFSGNASVDFCRSQKRGDYTSHKGNVSSIIGEKAHASIDSGSIIPAFFYNDGAGVRYYEGLNWPDATGVYAGGCQ